jgi:hypothetical protein
MGSHPKMAAFAALVLVQLFAPVAWAAETVTRAGAGRADVKKKPSGPTPMVKRGLILPPRLLDVYLTPMVERPVGDDNRRIGATLGALVGVAPELHADFQVTPFYFNAPSAAGTGRITITGRFVKTQPVDLGLSVITMFDASNPKFVNYVQPSVPAILRVNERLRVDVAVQVPLYTTEDPHFGFRVPGSVYLQITDRIHCGATSAIAITDLRNPPTTTSVPFGLTAGYSAGPELGFAAFTPYITWTNFYTPAGGAVDTKSFTAGIIADIAAPIP